METEALTRIAEAIEKGILPYCISIVGAIGPLILTCISMILTWLIYEQNKKLKKDLYNRDVINQTRQIFIQTYSSFRKAQSVVLQGSNNILNIFMSYQNYYAWNESINKVHYETMNSYYQMHLLLSDKDKRNYLAKCMLNLSKLTIALNNYIHSPKPSQMINNAWQNMWKNHNINIGDYNSVFQNIAYVEEFKKLCENDDTKNIQSKIKDFIDLINSDEFANYFYQYIKIEKID